MGKLFKEPSIKYNFLARVAIEAFALYSCSNTFLHKFFSKENP